MIQEAESRRIRQFIGERSDELEILRQNWLLSESGLITFAQERGTRVRGVISGDPSIFHKRGWLTNDGTDYHGGPMFHPFRLYPLERITSTRSQIRNAPQEETRANDESLLDSAFRERVETIAPSWNGIANLAIMLEPIYWPDIVMQSAGRVEDRHATLYSVYREKCLDLVRQFNPDDWQRVHADLRTQAAWLDDNPSLYTYCGSLLGPNARI